MTSEFISLDHGSGGKIAHRLTADLLLPLFDNPILSDMHDGAVLALNDHTRVAFSTDTFTVTPLFFPGGDIGELAVNGTINDVAMCGATPLFISLALIIEEGFPMADLTRILQSIQKAATRAGVQVVTGDTKVVPKGAADGLFINTSGIGLIPENVTIGSTGARPGDKIILSGTMADHGMTILTQREGLSFDSAIQSDSAPLNQMVAKILAASGNVHVLRDPTRGGVGTTLNEIAESSRAGIVLQENRLPVREAVAGVCELLGFDPLYVANEGKLLAFVAAEDAEKVLAAIQSDPFGREACVIGDVTAEHPGQVVLETLIGGRRIVDMLTGEQLPRIC
ncbi:MAG: hydrogenase expression/formation protein HypE [Deltaproteobacteria bacterium]|jgi:hydrogenase expression/formation protein HypE|nr:hydrogenase expression/formation protein HypE [Deltaproteobacteria bacterium]